MKELLGFLVLAVAFVFYMLPTFIASHRGVLHQNGITAVNFFLGWTVLGWIAALIWACAEKTEEEKTEPSLEESEARVAAFPRIVPAPSTINPLQNDFEDRWLTLTKYDEAVRAAVANLERYGAPAIAELKRAYRVIGDSSQVPRIAEQIAKKAKRKQGCIKAYD